MSEIVPDVKPPRIYGHHERDYEAYGERFAVHMDHMTSEQLHSKSDIAWELAYRDTMIHRLTRRLAELERK